MSKKRLRQFWRDLWEMELLETVFMWDANKQAIGRGRIGQLD